MFARVAFVAVILFFAILSDGGAMAAGLSLNEIEWVLEDIGGAGVIDNARSTIAFANDGGVNRNGACNIFRGKSEASDKSVKTGPLAVTLKACPPAVVDQEQNYLDALGRVSQWRLDGEGRLFLMDAAGADLLRFTPAG